LGGTAKIDFGGELYATDLLLALSLLLLVKRVPRLIQRGNCRLILVLGALWMLNLMITDVYRQTQFEDWSRGWSKNMFFFIDFCGLVLLTNFRHERILFFFAGSALSLLAQTMFFPYALQIVDKWKFGEGPALTLLAALVGTSRYLGLGGEIVPLAVLGAFNLAYNSREAFAISMAAAAFGVFKHAVDFRPRLRARITPTFFILVAGGGLMVAQGLVVIYSRAAESGLLGLEAKDKYEAQSFGDLPLILGGRTESLVSTQAVADSPILGHGSWAQDMYYVSLLVDILESKGITAVETFESALIPTHSHLLGSWVEGGIFGGLFWMVVIAIAMMAIYRSLKEEGLPTTFLAFILFSTVWDVLFSPFGASQRFSKAADLCVILWVLEWRRRTIKSVVQKNGDAPLSNSLS
jgi:hypothetical protein